MTEMVAAMLIATANKGSMEKPVSAIIHHGNEYWGYRIDPRRFQTCEGKMIIVQPNEKSVPIDVSCNDGGFNEHALHAKPKASHRPRP